MLWLFLIVGALAMLNINNQNRAGKAKALPPLPLDSKDPTVLMNAAKQAQVAGYVETAKALADKAADASEVAEAVKDATNDNARLFKSPIPEVGDGPWSAFANLYRGKNPGEISPSYHLGLFNIGFMRLRDLDLAHSLKQVDHNGRRVWVGQFTNGMNLQKFLSSPNLQYVVFTRDMAERAQHIRDNYGDLIGKALPEEPGTPATLSGLLAVIKISGTKGFDSWVRSRQERAKFDNTTKAFKAANGYF